MTKQAANKVFKGCGCGTQTVKGTPVSPAPTQNRIGFVPGKPYVAPKPQPTFWETDIEETMVKSCGVFDEKIEVLISTKARQKMTLLMEKFTRMEWLAYLVGDKDELIVEDIVIPKQRVTSVNVYVDEPVDVPIIGVIHSHHDMGNGFSHTDDDYINQNHDLSLCITNTKITGQLRVKTECGRFMLADVEVKDAIDGFDVVEFLKEVDDQISEKVYTPAAGNYYGGGIGGAGRGAGVTYPSHYGNSAGWEDFDDECWDTEAPSAAAKKVDRELISEINKYRDSIKGLAEVDDFYMVEFNMLANFINSIGTAQFEVWETKAFDDTNNVYTEDYYRLIDEISLFAEEATEFESKQLVQLAEELEKRCETSMAH